MNKRDITQEIIDGIKDIKAGNFKAYKFEVINDAKKVRTELKMSQDSFARYMGISKRTLQAWEIGARKPSGPALSLLRIAAKHPEAFRDISSTRKEIHRSAIR